MIKRDALLAALFLILMCGMVNAAGLQYCPKFLNNPAVANADQLERAVESSYGPAMAEINKYDASCQNLRTSNVDDLSAAIQSYQAQVASVIPLVTKARQSLTSYSRAIQAASDAMKQLSSLPPGATLGDATNCSNEINSEPPTIQQYLSQLNAKENTVMNCKAQASGNNMPAPSSGIPAPGGKIYTDCMEQLDARRCGLGGCVKEPTSGLYCRRDSAR